MKIQNLAAGLLASLLMVASAQVAASSAYNNQQPILPAIGQSDSGVLLHYGEPVKRMQGANGVDMWDYGTFRVIFRDDTVAFAAMWRKVD